jgi:hypothetical protein
MHYIYLSSTPQFSFFFILLRRIKKYFRAKKEFGEMGRVCVLDEKVMTGDEESVEFSI